MNCPRCGMPAFHDANVCAHCGQPLAVPESPPAVSPSPPPAYIPAAQNAPPVAWQPPSQQPVWYPGGDASQAQEAPLPDVDEEPCGEPSTRSVGETLATLLLGLIPLLGVFICLVLAYGRGAAADTRVLAKAMLWLHGIALALAAAVLVIWVFSLARSFAV